MPVIALCFLYINSFTHSNNRKTQLLLASSYNIEVTILRLWVAESRGLKFNYMQELPCSESLLLIELNGNLNPREI